MYINMFSSLEIQYPLVNERYFNLEDWYLWLPRIWLQLMLTLVIELYSKNIYRHIFRTLMFILKLFYNYNNVISYL